LLYSRYDHGIWAIPAGGQPVPVTTVRTGENSHNLPSLLPGGRVLLYTMRRRVFTWGNEAVIAQPLPKGQPKVLLTDAVDARYVPTGHLVFMRQGTLCAVPFDPVRLEKLGPEVPVLGDVVQALTARSANDATGAGQFAISPTGTVAWLPGPVQPLPQSRLVTVDRRGEVTPLPGDPRSYVQGSAQVSPDGRRLAVVVRTLTEQGLWIYDLTRPGPMLPLPPGGRRLIIRCGCETGRHWSS
jgi:hypothetical protein